MGAGFGEAEHSETETERVNRDFAFRPGAAAETETRNRDSCPFWQVLKRLFKPKHYTRRARFWSAEVREKRSHVADIAACSRRRLSLTAESEVDHRARHALSRQAEHIDGVTSELAAPTRRHQRIMRSARRVSVAS